MLGFACGGSTQDPTPVSNSASATVENTFDARYEKLRSVADRVCRCADAECVMTTMSELNTFPLSPLSPAENEPETTEQIDLLGAEAERAMKCADRVAAEGSGP
jgi:hypothetical protein